MKKLYVFMALLCLFSMFSSICYAEDITEMEDPMKRSISTYTTGYDGNGNRFTVKGGTSVGIHYGSAYTYYKVKNYGAGLKSSMYNVTCILGLHTDVSFSDGTTNNTTTLTGTRNVISGGTDSAVIETYTYSKEYSSFTGNVSQVSSRHTFSSSAGSGANKSFYTMAQLMVN